MRIAARSRGRARARPTSRWRSHPAVRERPPARARVGADDEHAAPPRRRARRSCRRSRGRAGRTVLRSGPQRPRRQEPGRWRPRGAPRAAGSSGSPASAIGPGATAALAQHEARLDRAVPLVELEPERRVEAPSSASGRRAVPKATARARTPPDSTLKRTCLPSPIGRGSTSRAAGTSSDSRGCLAERREPLELLGERQAELVAGDDRVDALDAGRSPRARATDAACASNAARNASTSARVIVHPAAARWPPWRISGAAHASRPAQEVEAGIERARARALGPSNAITTPGRSWRSAMREATIPITPGCQPSPART